MFDSLSEKLQETLSDVRQRGTLTEDDVDKVMREIRLALLEADVNFKVVKSFTAAVKERCLTEEVIGHLNPGQQVIKIVDEELTTLMGGAGAAHQRRQLLVDDLDHLLAGVQVADDLLRQAALLDVGGERLDDLEVDVGLQQRQPDLAQDLVHLVLGQRAALTDVGQGLLE